MKYILVVLLTTFVAFNATALPEWVEPDPQKYHCVVTEEDGIVFYQFCQDERDYIVNMDFDCRAALDQEGNPVDMVVCMARGFDPSHVEGYPEVYKSTDLCLDPKEENLPLFKDEQGVKDNCSIKGYGDHHEWIEGEPGDYM